LNTRTILGEQYRSVSSSLCSFPHSSVTRLCQHVLNGAMLNAWWIVKD
jgi:hypothetical protein